MLFFLQEPYLRSFEIDTNYPEFHISLTDTGMCQVYNGNSMKSTFAPTKRTEMLWTSLDQRYLITPKTINGSGKVYQKTFWLDIGERYRSFSQKIMGTIVVYPFRSTEAYKPDNTWPKGSATLNVNEWLKYFNVRSNPIDLEAGASYTIKMTPIQYTASPKVRDIHWERRNCLFKDEQEQQNQLNFILYLST